MGWADCGDDSAGRPIGYAFSATCDHPGCTERIHRGLSYACGGMHGTETSGGDDVVDWSSVMPSCEGYFCEAHLRSASFEHEDGADLCSPIYCAVCAEAHDRRYRQDDDYRSLWPTSALPL